MKQYRVNYRLLILLILVFILMTVVGTLSHELGHYAMAKNLGYEARINYKSSAHWDDVTTNYLREVYAQYLPEIKSHSYFPGREKYESITAKYESDNFWIVLGGPLQTMITGTIGLLLLLGYRNSCIVSGKVTGIGWTIIFLSLFWLRQVANLGVGILTFLMNGKVSPTGDEMRLALQLGINLWSIQLITGFIGLAVLFIVLRLLPKTMIPMFIVAGIVGGCLGYYLWLVKFGQYIIP